MAVNVGGEGLGELDGLRARSLARYAHKLSSLTKSESSRVSPRKNRLLVLLFDIWAAAAAAGQEEEKEGIDGIAVQHLLQSRWIARAGCVGHRLLFWVLHPFALLEVQAVDLVSLGLFWSTFLSLACWWRLFPGQVSRFRLDYRRSIEAVEQATGFRGHLRSKEDGSGFVLVQCCPGGLPRCDG